MTTYYVDPAATGSNNGTSWTDAWTSLQTAADTAAAGDIVYCQGTQALSAQIDIDTNDGTFADGYIKFIGVKSGTTNTPPQATDYDSGNGDNGYFILNGQDNAINGLSITKTKIWIENFKIHSCDGTAGIVASGEPFDTVLINVWCTDNAGHGVGEQLRGAVLFRCKLNGNGGSGLYKPGQGCCVVACEAIGNTGFGIYFYSAFSLMADCVVHSNGNGGSFCQARLICINSVIDGNAGHGIDVYSAAQSAPVFIGCRFTNNNGSGKSALSVRNAGIASLVGCYFGNNATPITGTYAALPIDGSTSHVVTAGTDTDETNGELLGGYKNIGADDFNLKDTATLRSQAIELD